MLFVELYKVMVKKVTFVGYGGAIAPSLTRTVKLGSSGFAARFLWKFPARIAFIFLRRFELDLSFSSNGHSCSTHKRIMLQFVCARKLVLCINTFSVLALVQCES